MGRRMGSTLKVCLVGVFIVVTWLSACGGPARESSAYVQDNLHTRIAVPDWVDRIECLDLAGQRHLVETPDEIADVLQWISRAEYESDHFPERDTGGGIMGEMSLFQGDGDVVEIAIHSDFLWFEQATYGLDEQTVGNMVRLLRGFH